MKFLLRDLVASIVTLVGFAAAIALALHWSN